MERLQDGWISHVDFMTAKFNKMIAKLMSEPGEQTGVCQQSPTTRKYKKGKKVLKIYTQFE